MSPSLQVPTLILGAPAVGWTYFCAKMWMFCKVTWRASRTNGLSKRMRENAGPHGTSFQQKKVVESPVCFALRTGPSRDAELKFCPQETHLSHQHTKTLSTKPLCPDHGGRSPDQLQVPTLIEKCFGDRLSFVLWFLTLQKAVILCSLWILL